MKRLNLLKPDIRTGYLDDGKGQEVTYLSVPSHIGIKEMEEDVAGGAALYEEALAFAKKKPSKFVVVNCDNEEEGLMAVSYLSAIYNRMEKVEEDVLDEEEDDISDDPDIVFEDFEDPLFFDDDEEEDEDDWESCSHWRETPWKIPVVSGAQLVGNEDSPFSHFGQGGVFYGRVNNHRGQLPYWYYTRKEQICIVYNVYGEGVYNLTQKLKRYQNNRHVFIVAVTDRKLSNLLASNESFFSPNKGAFSELVLEYAAGSIRVAASEKERTDYYHSLFENWIQKKGYDLDPRFPVKGITDRIVDMENKSKSQLMERVINYVIKDDTAPRTLSEADFDILSQFKELGMNLSRKEHKHTGKLQNELVGMESVKEQIQGIIEVMRYNKRREKMGLSTNHFHNVHMMLGAPGTAKTTVAEILGNIMAEEHLLNGNRFVSINGAELKGMFVGHSAPKVKALFDDHDIIFIDEAYAVCTGVDGSSDSFSQEAIAALIVELEKHGMDRLVMFAGYGGSQVSAKDNRMKQFLESNPGVRSRINSTIYFDSYTAEQMVEIFKCHAKMGEYTVPRKAEAAIKEFFEKRVLRADFGNGREARSLLENSIVEAAKRLAALPEESITEKMMKEIKAEDIQNAMNRMSAGLNMQYGKELKLGFQ